VKMVNDFFSTESKDKKPQVLGLLFDWVELNRE